MRRGHTAYLSWLIHMRDMTHSHVWHDSFICVTWLFHMYDMTHSHVTWLVHMSTTFFFFVLTSTCDINLSYMTWLFHMWHAPYIHYKSRDTYIHVWHASLICHMPHSLPRLKSHLSPPLNQTYYVYVYHLRECWSATLVYMCNMPHSTLQHSHTCNQNHRSLLQKSPIKARIFCKRDL